MKTIFCVMLVCISMLMTLSCASQPASGGEPFVSGGTLVWSDEFDGDSLDLSKWNIETGTGAQYGLQGWGNNENEFYKPENVIVKDGALILEARMDNDPANNRSGEFPYTSGKISTGGIMNHDATLKDLKYTVKPGMRVEARIKSTRGPGLWPGFWLIGATSNEYSGFKQVSWPRCGEIDILEVKGGSENRVNCAIHYGHAWNDAYGSTGEYMLVEENMADDWHVYGVTWDKDTLHFLYDGEPWHTIDLKMLNSDNRKYHIVEAFNAKSGFVININLAVGGNYIGGQRPDDSIFGEESPVEDRQFKLDWVRVYQK